MCFAWRATFAFGLWALGFGLCRAQSGFGLWALQVPKPAAQSRQPKADSPKPSAQSAKPTGQRRPAAGAQRIDWPAANDSLGVFAFGRSFAFAAAHSFAPFATLQRLLADGSSRLGPGALARASFLLKIQSARQFLRLPLAPLGTPSLHRRRRWSLPILERCCIHRSSTSNAAEHERRQRRFVSIQWSCELLFTFCQRVSPIPRISPLWP